MTAPASKPEVATPRLTQEQVERWRMHNGAVTTNEFIALCDLALEALLVNPASAPQDATEAKDAARYRWLRSPGNDKKASYIFWQNSGSYLDTAIDAAIAAEREGK